MSLVRVVGLSGPTGRDDRVGLEVVRWLTIEGRPAGCELAERMLGDRLCRRLDLVGVSVVGPEGAAYELSTDVARAIPAAVAAVRACVAGASGMLILDDAATADGSGLEAPTTPAGS